MMMVLLAGALVVAQPSADQVYEAGKALYDAKDYAGALEQYYGGRQKAMAERLEVSEGWLSRYLTLARLPDIVVSAYASIRDIKELHARTLKPLLAGPKSGPAVLEAAQDVAARQTAAREGKGAPIEGHT